jgi:peptidoglycan/xylan/chitin deacetylase (PgdA/CDA1 family)
VNPVAWLASAWRKNSPELLGFLNGALPDFVRSGRPADSLDGVPVFSYHVVDAEVFEADCRFLRRNGYVTLWLDELLDVVAGRRATTGREVALTFDDGPRNFHDVAFPLLRDHGLRGTIFIAPGLHADDYLEFQSQALRPMTWAEVRAVQASGLVSVQSHTLQSQYLPGWPMAAPLAGVDPRIEARLRRPPLSVLDDFRAAREVIESQCPGAQVRHLCYPMYHATPEAHAALAPAGYVAGYGGLLPGRPLVRTGSAAGELPRLSWEFLRRMPGEGRLGLRDLVVQRIGDARRARQRTRVTDAGARG